MHWWNKLPHKSSKRYNRTGGVNMKGKRLISIVVVFAIVLVGFIYNYNDYSLASERTTLEPTIYDDTGVDVNSEFILSVVEQRKLEEIQNGLTISPQVDFDITSKGNGQYAIKFEEELERNSIYVFDLSLEGFDSSWAFQTQKEFEIIGTLPRDKSQGVPVNSGIEIIFTHRELSEIDKYFEISPKANGRFEYHKNTVVFVPDELEAETIYTVTIKKGLELKNSEQKIQEDIVFQFETNKDYTVQEEYIDFVDVLPEFSTFEKPVLNVVYYDNSRKSSEEKLDLNVDINVYKYKNYEDFMNVLENDDKPYWSQYSKTEHLYNTENLDLTSSFNIDLVVDNYSKYLMFPEELDEGYYLIEGKKGEKTFQTHIQITNISAYYSESESKTLFWVHNLEDKKPLDGAKIEFEDEAINSDNSGIAIYDGSIENEESYDKTKYIKISKDNMNPLILRVYPQYGLYYGYDGFYYNPQSNEHLSYLFLDRGMYKPEDLINFWGVVKSLKNESIDKITVELDNGYWFGSDSYLLKREVSVREDGTFDAQIKLPNLKEGYYNLTIKQGEKIITTTGIQIERYVKPEYKLNIIADKKAIFIGEDINFEVLASFFEGTPVANLEINYNFDGRNKTIMTDNTGKVNLSYTADNSSYSSPRSYYDYRNLFINSRLPEIAEITANKSFYVYTKDQMITAKSDVEDNKGMVTINLNHIDLTKINNSEEQNNYYKNESVIGEPVENKEVTVRLIKHEWEKIEDGVEYDFINKTTVKKYRYETREVTVEKKSLVTDTSGEISYEFDIEKDGRYSVEITSEDSKGRQIYESVYVYDYNPFYYQSESRSLKSDKEQYSVGEEVKLSYLEGEEPVDHTGDILFIKAQNGILDYSLRNEENYEFNFQSEHIPNIYVHGIAFNGKTYKATVSPAIRIDPLDKELKVEIESNKSDYKPGEEVTLDIKVLDKHDNPIKARVNISIVDEAFFSLREQYVDILNDLFSTIPDGITRTYASHNNEQNDIGIYRFGAPELVKMDGSFDMNTAITADEAEAEIRSEFKDTALFKTVETDEEGNGQITFALPHNITEWRITYQAVSKDLNAGDGQVNVSATLPFFTEAVLNNTYLEGDKPIIAVNSHGLQLEEGEKVIFEISAPSLGINEFQQVQGEAFKQSYFELPKLTLGEHKVIIKAKSTKGYSDGLEKTITVVPTYHTEMVNDFHELSDNLKIKGSDDGITTLVFTDLNRGKYYYDLISLKYSHGVRVDQILSSEVAKELLETLFNEEIMENSESNLYRYQTDDGGVSLLPYSESELELTAKIADLAHEKFDKSQLLQYFNAKLEEGRDEAIILYGKASLGEPVINELNKLSKVNNLSVKDRLYIALAYEKNGHKEGALKILSDIITQNGESNETYLRIDKGVDKDDILEVTSLAMVLASRLNIDERTMLYEYVKYHHGEDILVNLEKLMYLQKEISGLPDVTASFKYHLGDDVKEISLENGISYRLSIIPENLEKLAFSEIKGDIAVNVEYEEVISNFASNNDKYTSIRREYYTLDGEKTNTFNATDIVKVVIYPSIDDKAFNGSYEVVDILPAGLKPIENHWNRNIEYDGDSRYPWDFEGQKVKFYTHSNSKYKNRPMVYYARVISKGEYNCERAVIKNTVAKDTASYTESDIIIIE